MIVALTVDSPGDFLTSKGRFIRRWQSRLLVKDLNQAKVVVRGNREAGMVVSMNDGSWVSLVMEHSCCTGAGFNATVFVSSDGASWVDTESCRCGNEDLFQSIAPLPHSSVHDFFTGMKAAGIPVAMLRGVEP